MHPPVREQVSGRPEVLPAGGAGEGFLPTVDGLVLLEDAPGDKSLPAGVADERADAGVDGLVSFQQVHPPVRFPTDGAGEGFLLPVVAKQVRLEFLLESELFVAAAARPQFPLLRVVRLQVSLQRLLPAETFVAAFAGERFVVTAHVLPQLVAVVETFVAFLAEDSFLLMLLLPPPVSLLAVTSCKA